MNGFYTLILGVADRDSLAALKGATVILNGESGEVLSARPLSKDNQVMVTMGRFSAPPIPLDSFRYDYNQDTADVRFPDLDIQWDWPDLTS